jgi:hypothetical protein
MLSDRTLAYAEKVTTALLGVDAFYRTECGDEEGLVVLNMAAGLPETDRQRYYDQLCHSTLAFIQ